MPEERQSPDWVSTEALDQLALGDLPEPLWHAVAEALDWIGAARRRGGEPWCCCGAYATSLKRTESAESSSLSIRFSCPWIWQTRLSETPRMPPISRSVRFLT